MQAGSVWEDENGCRQFDLSVLVEDEDCISFAWDMREEDFPVFAACDSNFQAEAALRAAGVILPEDETGTEYDSLVVHFPGRAEGLPFLTRLNEFLRGQ